MPINLHLTRLIKYIIAIYAGLDDKGIEGPALLEADQGDTLMGVVSLEEAAAMPLTPPAVYLYTGLDHRALHC
jgi:hypothetical protein